MRPTTRCSAKGFSDWWKGRDGGALLVLSGFLREKERSLNDRDVKSVGSWEVEDFLLEGTCKILPEDHGTRRISLFYPARCKHFFLKNPTTWRKLGISTKSKWLMSFGQCSMLKSGKLAMSGAVAARTRGGSKQGLSLVPQSTILALVYFQQKPPEPQNSVIYR